MDVLDTRRPRLLLAIFCLVLWLPGFFSIPPTDRDESRFAQASKQMIETGDYVRIMNGAEPRNRKPIGIYWLQVPFAALAQAVGVATANPIWPYRIPSLLGGLAGVLATFSLGQTLVGRRAALLAAGMLAASVVLVAETHLAKTDAALLGASTIAIGLLARAYLVPERLAPAAAAAFWLSLAGTILLKGPIGPMIAGLTVLALVGVDRRGAWLRRLRPGWGIPLMLLAVLPWFVAIGVATHGAFFRDAVGGDLAAKLTSGDDAHGAPPGLHALLAPLLIFPSTLPMILAIPIAWATRRQPGVRFLLCWLIPSWLVFEIVPTKLPHYTLPLYPALCLLAAWGCVEGAQAGRGGWGWSGHAVTAVVSLVLAGGVMTVAILGGAGWWVALPAVIACGMVAACASLHRPILALTGMPLVTMGVLGWVVPHSASLWIAPAVADIWHHGGRLGAVGYHEPSLVFLLGTDTVLLPDGRAAAAALLRHDIDGVVITRQAEAPMLQDLVSATLTAKPVGSVAGFNYSRGRSVTLDVLRLP